MKQNDLPNNNKKLSTEDLLKTLQNKIEDNTEDQTEIENRSRELQEQDAADTAKAEIKAEEPAVEAAPMEEMKIEDLIEKYLPQEDRRFAQEQEPSDEDDDVELTDSDFEDILGTTANIPAIREGMRPEDYAPAAQHKTAPAESDDAPMVRPAPRAEKSGGLTGLMKKFRRDRQAPADDLSEGDTVNDLYDFTEQVQSDSADTAQTDVGNEVAQISDGSEEFDETDAKIMMAFGMEDKLAQTIGMDRVTQLGTDIENAGAESAPKKTRKFRLPQPKAPEEYTDLSQTKAMFEEYRRSFLGILVRLALCAVLFVFTFFYENIGMFGGSLTPALNSDYFPAVHLLVDLQILVLACALIWRSLLSGARQLFSGKPGPESVTFVTVAVTLLFYIASAVHGTSLRLFNFPVILCILMNLVYEYLNTKREIYALNVISSRRPKYCVERTDAQTAALEVEAFGDHLPRDPVIFRVRKTDFVDHFRERAGHSTKYRSIIRLLLPVTGIATVLLFILGLIITRNLYTALTCGYLTFLLCMPASTFISMTFPVYQASKEAFGVQSAFIGEDAFDEYSGASAVSFEDKEVFPPYGVKVKSIKVYGEYRIDQVLYQLSSVFSQVGGPLAEVLTNATKELGKSEQVEIEEILDNGLAAVVDGTRVFLGKAAYLYDIGVPPVVDADDEAMEEDPETSIMFMVVNGEVAAKIYVQYVIDPDFAFVVKQMYRIGVCVGIKTFDPNIDDEMIQAHVQDAKYPVRILKCRTADDAQITEPHMDSGLVSKSGAKSLLQAMSLCDRIVNAIKTNFAVKAVSMFLSLVLMGALLAFGAVTGMLSFYVALYQIFWMIPMVAASRTLIGRL